MGLKFGTNFHYFSQTTCYLEPYKHEKMTSRQLAKALVDSEFCENFKNDHFHINFPTKIFIRAGKLWKTVKIRVFDEYRAIET